MNFLAHLWLADRTHTSLAGSVLGDVVRGSDLSAYPDDIALGIRLHRRVDAATDRHPIVVEARGRFAAGERRYAGIVLDLAADHALANAWAEFHPDALTDFTQRCGVAMEAAGEWFERGGGARTRATGFAQLIQSYATDAGMERAVQRTAARMRDPQRLIEAARRWPEASQMLRPRLAELLEALLAVMRRQEPAAVPAG
ncbi:MAG: acyl carrier protein phosphodiesterase [Panacagrimonas sp.]